MKQKRPKNLTVNTNYALLVCSLFNKGGSLSVLQTTMFVDLVVKVFLHPEVTRAEYFCNVHNPENKAEYGDVLKEFVGELKT